MIEINEILNKPGQLKCFANNRETEVTGNLFIEENNYLLYINISSVDYNLFCNAHVVHLCGQIAGRDFTIPNGYVKTRAYCGGCWGITIIPDQIVLGICIQEELKVDKISAQITALNPMFASTPARMAVPSQENSALINLVAVQPIQAEDEEMKISCTRTVGFSESVSGIEIPFVVLLECSLKHSVSLETALAKIASVRNLFSFFGDRYIPLDNIEISIGNDENVYNEKKYTVVLNYGENIKETNRPFFIGSDLLTDNFHSIWTNWAKLYKQSKNIAALFYEIICERSRGINYFLNLSQAIELYSQHYREEKVRNIAERDNFKGNNLPLKYRYEDLFTLYADILNIEAVDIPIAVQNLSNARNYFTHYNDARYMEPSNNFITYASIFLRFLLLCIVYDLVGISRENIIHHLQGDIYSALDTCKTTIIQEKIR